MKKLKPAPVITIDGPSGVGKGTVAHKIAEVLGWHFLDSGAIYRLLALKISFTGMSLKETDVFIDMAKHLEIGFKHERCYLESNDVTDEIRQEDIGLLASKISAIPDVRKALFERQRAFAEPPGLITDGRDMGSVVFPEAVLKFYLDASPEIRAERRALQLKQRGIGVIFTDLLQDIKQRDQQDKTRSVAPLVVPKGAIVIDSGHLNKEQLFDVMMTEVNRCLKIGDV